MPFLSRAYALRSGRCSRATPARADSSTSSARSSPATAGSARSQFAAAISYRALFSLVPLATFVATILAQVLSAERRQPAGPRLGDHGPARPHRRAEPPGSTALIAAVPSPWSLAGLVALGLALWGATGVMSSVLKTLAVVFDERRRPQLRSRPARQRVARARRPRADPLRRDRLDARERRQQGERERRGVARLAAVRVRHRARRRRPARR